MKSLKILRTVILFVLLCIITPYAVIAQDTMDVDWFSIMPKLSDKEIVDVSEKIEWIWHTWWSVWSEYTKAASGMSVQEQVASWIMNRDTIMNYLVFLVKFLSQLWLTVGAIFIMYAWYIYMLSVFKLKGSPTSAIKNAIIWVIIVIFSYAILKFLTSLIGIS